MNYPDIRHDKVDRAVAIMGNIYRHGPNTVNNLAWLLDVSSSWVRNILWELHDVGYVGYETDESRRIMGRPRYRWHLTSEGHQFVSENAIDCLNAYDAQRCEARQRQIARRTAQHLVKAGVQ